jgi:hypothetical protein
VLIFEGQNSRKPLSLYSQGGFYMAQNNFVGSIYQGNKNLALVQKQT